MFATKCKRRIQNTGHTGIQFEKKKYYDKMLTLLENKRE